MGRAKRVIPSRLPGKLLQIRLTLGGSQDDMVRILKHPEAPGRNYISGFELGTREPTLGVLARYADIVNCWIDVLVRDELLLPPPPWPCRIKSEGIGRGVRRR
jgi:transcriptional regulator with XRE-family HTH domain